jgi:hypothetical protein
MAGSVGMATVVCLSMCVLGLPVRGNDEEREVTLLEHAREYSVLCHIR